MQANVNGSNNVIAGGNVNFITNLIVNWPRLSGAIRVGVGLGLALFLGGFAAWGYFVLAWVVTIFGIVISGFSRSGFPGLPHVDFVSPIFLVIGAALMFAGIVILAISGFAATGSARKGTTSGN